MFYVVSRALSIYFEDVLFDKNEDSPECGIMAEFQKHQLHIQIQFQVTYTKPTLSSRNIEYKNALLFKILKESNIFLLHCFLNPGGLNKRITGAKATKFVCQQVIQNKKIEMFPFLQASKQLISFPLFCPVKVCPYSTSQ